MFLELIWILESLQTFFTLVNIAKVRFQVFIKVTMVFVCSPTESTAMR